MRILVVPPNKLMIVKCGRVIDGPIQADQNGQTQTVSQLAFYSFYEEFIVVTKHRRHQLTKINHNEATATRTT